MATRRRATYSTRFDKANRKFEDTTRRMGMTPIDAGDRDVETHIGGISEDEALRGRAGSTLEEEPLATTGKSRTKSGTKTTRRNKRTSR